MVWNLETGKLILILGVVIYLVFKCIINMLCFCQFYDSVVFLSRDIYKNFRYHVPPNVLFVKLVNGFCLNLVLR